MKAQGRRMRIRLLSYTELMLSDKVGLKATISCQFQRNARPDFILAAKTRRYHQLDDITY